MERQSESYNDQLTSFCQLRKEKEKIVGNWLE